MAQKRKAERNVMPAAAQTARRGCSEQSCGGGTLYKLLLAVIVFVSPLIFFTGLTRNPYYTQITLCNAALLAIALVKAARVWRRDDFTWKFSPPDIPWAGWLFACGLSWLISYFGHEVFFRPAIASEGLRAFLFLLVNTFGAYLLGKSASPEPDEKPSGWLLVFAVWALLWGMYPGFRQNGGSDMLSNVFDPYGTVLWAAGIAVAFMALGRCGRESVVNLAMATGALAAAYGVLQYFGVEPIWTRALNPYGARSVSTFGNPNFLSSYLVILLPLVFIGFLRSAGTRRVIFGAVFVLYTMSLLCSLTRSSWLGALTGMAFLFALPEVRALVRKAGRAVAVLAAICLILIPFWPSGAGTERNPSVAERVMELKGMRTSALPQLDAQTNMYSPWHQRLLIWSNCAVMGLENPLTGKGWGVLELFYPYYQGPLLAQLPQLRELRTHANNAHNEIIEAFSQTGIVGLGARLWLFAVFFAGFFMLRRKAGPARTLFAAGAAAGLAGMLADNMLNVSLHFSAPAFLFWWLAGALGADCCGVREYTFRPARAWFKTGAALAAALLMFFIWFWYSQWLREIYYFRGFTLARRGEITLAADALEKSAACAGREVNALYELANVYSRQGNEEKALQTYARALAANAGYDEIFFNRALVEHKLGRQDASLSDALVCAWINPLNSRVYDLLAEIFLADQKKYAARCLPPLRTAVQVFPEDVTLKSIQGVMAVAAGNMEEARQVFRAGAEQSPLSDVLFENYRKIMTDSGRASDPSVIRLERVRALGRQAEAPGAGLALTSALDGEIALNPDWEFLRILKGRVAYVAHDYDGVRKALAPVLARNPSSVGANSGLAAAAAAQGDYAAARRALERVLAADPHNKEAQANMVRLQQGSQN